MLTNIYIKTNRVFKRFHTDKRGVTVIEYAIIAVAISAIALALFGRNGKLGTALSSAMDTITNNISNANSTN
jgi:pilus assembly protein Flp/PilA